MQSAIFSGEQIFNTKWLFALSFYAISRKIPASCRRVSLNTHGFNYQFRGISIKW